MPRGLLQHALPAAGVSSFATPTSYHCSKMQGRAGGHHVLNFQKLAWHLIKIHSCTALMGGVLKWKKWFISGLTMSDVRLNTTLYFQKEREARGGSYLPLATTHIYDTCTIPWNNFYRRPGQILGIPASLKKCSFFYGGLWSWRCSQSWPFSPLCLPQSWIRGTF